MSLTSPARLAATSSREPWWGRCHVVVLIALLAMALTWPGPAAAWFWDAPDYEQINADLADDYPDVSVLTVTELKAWLDNNKRQPPLIIDTRTREEYLVSHLPGALHAEHAADVQNILSGQPANRELVLYCSVGVRSGRVAHDLVQAGVTQAYNLSGSVFEWANRGLPLVADGQPTRQVHPFNARWGKLLEHRLWSHEP